MALTKEQKADQIKKLTVQLKDAESVMFSNYIGLNVADVSEFRNKLREGNAEMKVAKKTLIQRACKEAGLPEIPQDDLTGPVACIFSFEDPLSGAQIAFKFAKKHDQVVLVGGVYDGKVLTKEEATELAKMPSRDQLLAKFVGMLQSPLNSFASLCTSPLGGFARALDQMADKGGFVKDEAPIETPQDKPAAEPAPAAEEKAEEKVEEKAEEAPAAEAAASTQDPKPEAAPAAEDETES
ncbi:50S ribosomal protein L10 [Candidatus Peregrinibacteria bacterium]|jgi:large subunit ribosomal protein L10|nr:50S ribosomal protein L10 [Candidatus Peregrinibacteria bacterium]